MLETSPVIRDVGTWVLEKALSDVAQMRRLPGLESLSVSVNFSGRHLVHVGAIDDVRSALETIGLPPDVLTIEITETAIADLATVSEHTHRLRELGVRVAIDDFGTGYTSVSQLSLLPIQTLKIDRSFVDQMQQPASRRIVELVIEVGHTLGLQVVAEGVEEGSQREQLAGLGCDLLQGYFFSRPLSTDALAMWANTKHQQARV
jgi:EAL domain-containing protein (putative c-di-GMP-specific phosphodiesterase class I)